MDIISTDSQALTDEQFISLLVIAFLSLIDEVSLTSERVGVSMAISKVSIEAVNNTEPEKIKELVDAARQAFTVDWYFYQDK